MEIGGLVVLGEQLARFEHPLAEQTSVLLQITVLEFSAVG